MSKKAGDFDLFCKVIRETITLFDELLALEGKKIDAIAENDIALLDQYMNDEQVYLLQMKGLDYKREKMQEQLGMQSLTFRQMIDEFDGTERESLASLYEELSSKSAELKEAITSTKRFIDLHLNSISALLEKLDGGQGTYNKSGEKESKEPPARFTPTKA